MLEEPYKPEEVRTGRWEALRDAPPWAVDAWGLGCLVQEAFSGAPLARPEDLRNLGGLPPGIQKEYQRLLASAAARRLDPARLREAALFAGCKLLETVTFLEKLAIKDSSEKDAFFRKLGPTLGALPPAVVAERRVGLHIQRHT